MTKNSKMTRKCLNVTIYDYDAKSKNILKSGFLRKKNSIGHIFHFLSPKIQKLCYHGICQKTFCNFGSKRLEIKSVEFFLQRNPDFRIFLDFAS